MCVGPNRRSRFLNRWKLKRSGQRIVTFTPLEEVLEETRIPLAQCFAYRMAFDIPDDLVSNTDHTMMMVRQKDGNSLFICGFGNGGRRKLQGDGATFTEVPIDFNGSLMGSFGVVQSQAKAINFGLSKQAINKFASLSVDVELKIYRDKIGKVSHVGFLTSSSNGWMQGVNMPDWVKFIVTCVKEYRALYGIRQKEWVLVLDGWEL